MKAAVDEGMKEVQGRLKSVEDEMTEMKNQMKSNFNLLSTKMGYLTEHVARENAQHKFGKSFAKSYFAKDLLSLVYLATPFLERKRDSTSAQVRNAQKAANNLAVLIPELKRGGKKEKQTLPNVPFADILGALEYAEYSEDGKTILQDFTKFTSTRKHVQLDMRGECEMYATRDGFNYLVSAGEVKSNVDVKSPSVPQLLENLSLIVATLYAMRFRDNVNIVFSAVGYDFRNTEKAEDRFFRVKGPPVPAGHDHIQALEFTVAIKHVDIINGF